MKRLLIFFIFLIAGLVTFFISITFSPVIPETIEWILRTGLILVLLGATLLFKFNKKLEPFWKIAGAFFIASLSYFLSWGFSGKLLILFNLSEETATGLACAKLFESILIVLPILVFYLCIMKESPRDIYLGKGRMFWSIFIGGITFIGMFSLSIIMTVSSGTNPEIFKKLALPILIFVISNGFMEELLAELYKKYLKVAVLFCEDINFLT